MQCSGNRFSTCFTIKLWQMKQYTTLNGVRELTNFFAKKKHQHAKTWTHENSSPEKSHETTTLLKWQLCLCLASCTRHSQRNISKFIFIFVQNFKGHQMHLCNVFSFWPYGLPSLKFSWPSFCPFLLYTNISSAVEF